MYGQLHHHSMALIAQQRTAELLHEANQSRMAASARQPRIRRRVVGPVRRLVGRLAPAT